MMSRFAKGVAVLLLMFAAAQTGMAQTPEELKAKLPQLAGWEVDALVETFDGESLFERINGAAPGYLLFGFKELTVFVYNQKGGGEDAPYITLQLYRHATVDDAFGIYASERSPESSFVPVGAEGYQEGSMLNFFVDHLYVKIESPSSADATVAAVRQIAEGLATAISGQASFPERLRCLPDAGKVAHTEQYIPTGFLGHEFLNNAYTAVYGISGKEYQLFVIDAGSSEKAAGMLEAYFRFTGQKTKPREGRLRIRDRYNGTLECQWGGRYVWGIVCEGDAPAEADDLLKEIGEKL